MNWKTFVALLSRDAHVARRNVIQILLKPFLQPMMFVFIFGTRDGQQRLHARIVQEVYCYRAHGDQHDVYGCRGRWRSFVASISLLTRLKIGLLAPIENDWLAIEKVLFGAVQAVVAGLGCGYRQDG
jgi:hypothetical protein